MIAVELRPRVIDPSSLAPPPRLIERLSPLLGPLPRGQARPRKPGEHPGNPAILQQHFLSHYIPRIIACLQ